MALIRIPLADTQAVAPNPGAGQVRANLQPSMRDGGAGQMSPRVARREAAMTDPRAGFVDPNAASAEAMAQFAAARSMGQAALRAGEAIGQFAQAEADLQAQTAMTRADVELSRRTRERAQAFETQTFESSQQAATRFREASAEDVKQIAESLSGRTRTLWEARSGQIIEAREFNVEQSARVRILQSSIAVGEEGLRTFGNEAAAARNPVERAQIMARGEQIVADLQASGAINPQAAARMLRGFRQDVQMADVNRLMGTNPAAAIALLNNTQATSDIDADRRAALINQALNRQDTMAARARAEQNLRETRAARAVAEMDGLLRSGVVPAARAEAALSLARGTPLEAQVRQQIEDGRTLAQFRTATPERQQELLIAATARVQAGNASDRDLANAQNLMQAQQQQREGYARDGWMQGVRDGLIERTEMPPPLNIADPATITARFALSDRLTAARQQPVPVFSASEVQEINRQVAAARDNPAALAQIVAGINAIPDERIRAATFRQIEAGGNGTPAMERGTLTIMGRLANGTPAQQRAAQQVSQAVTADVSERIRSISEGPELRAALEAAMSTPEMQAIQAAARLGGANAAELNATQGIIRRMAAVNMAQGASPSDAVRLAMAALSADQVTINRPGLAQVRYDASLNLGAPEAVERGLRTMRDGFTARIPLDPALGQEANSRNREILRLAGQAEWVTLAPGRFGLVATGDYGQRVVLMEATAEQVRTAVQGVQTRRVQETAPRPPGERRTGRMVPPAAPLDEPMRGTPETVRPSIQ